MVTNLISFLVGHLQLKREAGLIPEIETMLTAGGIVHLLLLLFLVYKFIFQIYFRL